MTVIEVFDLVVQHIMIYMRILIRLFYTHNILYTIMELIHYVRPKRLVRCIIILALKMEIILYPCLYYFCPVQL